MSTAWVPSTLAPTVVAADKLETNLDDVARVGAEDAEHTSAHRSRGQTCDQSVWYAHPQLLVHRDKSRDLQRVENGIKILMIKTVTKEILQSYFSHKIEEDTIFYSIIP